MRDMNGGVIRCLCLLYGPVLIAHVQVDGVTVETWEGSCEIALRGESAIERRLADFIAFSCDFWRRFDAESEQNPSILNEIDHYEDVVRSGSWCMRSSNGDSSRRLDHALMFLNGDRLVWKYE